MAARYERLTHPLVRDGGALREATWEEALDRAATGLFSCSKATNETNFAAQKFARIALGTNNIDSCNRT
jgi:predicted molibdopterin-dependent oxidoreductase YjgC